MKGKGLSGFLALIILGLSLNSCNGEEEIFANCVLYQDCPEEEENALNPEARLMIVEEQ